ncbi:unnamed protein product [Amoebophrya sp. A120]|nr:unnamed protein product [Amoebophrya sp. A120]|eukprot:GSA120T00005086001.1
MAFFTMKYGTCCGCVPAKAGISFLSLVLFVAGLGQLCLWTVYSYKTFGYLKTEPATTAAGIAQSPISCDAVQKWSYYLRISVDAVVATGAGFVGILAGLDNSAGKLKSVRTGAFLLLGLRLAVFIWDCSFLGVCAVYPYNVMASAVFGSPFVSNDAQTALEKWTRYPSREADKAAGLQVFTMYVATTVVIVLVVLYLARVIDRATDMMGNGPTGLGEFYGLVADTTENTGIVDGERVQDELPLVKLSDSHPLNKPVEIGEEYGFQMGFGFYTEPEGKFQT